MQSSKASLSNYSPSEYEVYVDVDIIDPKTKPMKLTDNISSVKYNIESFKNEITNKKSSLTYPSEDNFINSKFISNDVTMSESDKSSNVDEEDEKSNNTNFNNQSSSKDSKYKPIPKASTQSNISEFTSWRAELNAEKFKADIILKSLSQRFKAAKITYVTDIISTEMKTKIITLKTKALIQNKQKNVYLTMTFSNLEDLNQAISIDIPIDNLKKESESHAPLRMKQIKKNPKKSRTNLQDKTIKI